MEGAVGARFMGVIMRPKLASPLKIFLAHPGTVVFGMAEEELDARSMDVPPFPKGLSPMRITLVHQGDDVFGMVDVTSAQSMDALPFLKPVCAMRIVLAHLGFDVFVMEEEPCSVKECTKTARRRVATTDSFGPPGPRCFRHGGGKTKLTI